MTFLLLGAVTVVGAQPKPTAEQLKEFRRLSPEQRAAVREAAEGQLRGQVDEAKLEQPRP